MPIHHRRGTCRLCDSARVERVVEIAPIPLAEKYVTDPDAPAEVYPTDLYMCLECSHVQLLDVIDPAVLWKDYTYHSGQTRGILDHFETVASRVVDRFGIAPGSLVIDVGSNDGSLLRAFQRRGMSVLGIDPAEEIARTATASGVETIPKLFTAPVAREIRERYPGASVVTAFNVFAHTDDMAGMTDSIRQVLGPQGVFVFEAQYLLDIIDKNLLGTIFHEHICHHSVKPIQRFLARHGLELIDVERVSIQNGSIIGVAQHQGGSRAVGASVGELLALEAERRLDRPETLRAFGDRIAAMSRKSREIVSKIQSEGKVIAAYGAARSGPTFINQFGFADCLKWIFDDHPQKVGKLSPQHLVPVLPTARLYELRPDYVVILAWIHAKKIVQSNRRFVEEGGRFLVCSPEVEIVDLDHPYLASPEGAPAAR